MQKSLQERLRKMQSELQSKTIAAEFEKINLEKSKTNSELYDELEIAEQQLINVQHENANREEITKM